MKKILALAVLTFISNTAFAESGQYFCKDVETPANLAAPIQKALNSMSCDTSKPISINAMEQSSVSLVCCVQK